MRRDTGQVQLGWMTRLVVVLGIVGVFGYDGFSILSTHIKGEDDAQNAAQAASTVWVQTHSIQATYQAAVGYVAGRHETILTRGFSVDPDNTVHLLLRRRAPTVVIGHIGPLHHYTIETVHGDDSADPS